MATVETIDEARALIGKVFGSGKDMREVTRIENLGTNDWGDIVGSVYWKHPGGEERKLSNWLPYFLKWVRKAERDAARTPIDSTLSELPSVIDEALADVHIGTRITGFISRKDDEVTISFKIK